MAGDSAGGQIAHHDALGVAIDKHQIQHFVARIHGHSTLVDLLFQPLIATDEKLLAGLAAGIKRAGYLCPAKRTVI